MSLALEWKGQEYTAREEKRRGRIEHVAQERKCAEERRRMRLVFICFICVAAFVSGLFILSICLHVVVVQNEMKVREVEKQIDLERRQQEAMRVEIASLESPARIESIAVEQLKMIPITQAEYLETPAYRTAKLQEQEGLTGEEGMVSDATQGGP
jgi:cell division protein FtsL